MCSMCIVFPQEVDTPFPKLVGCVSPVKYFMTTGLHDSK